MNRIRQHRLTLALLFSLLLHLVAMGSPGWHVPTLEEMLPSTEVLDARLDAQLIIPAQTPVTDVRMNAPTVSSKATRSPSKPLTSRPRVRQMTSASTVPAPQGVLAMPPILPMPQETAADEAQSAADAGRVRDVAEPDTADTADTADTGLADAALALANMNAHDAQGSETRTTSAHAGARNDTRSVTASGLQLPRRGHVRFNVTRGEQGFVMGQSVHHWNHDDKSYVLNSVTETTGLIALFRSVRVVWLSQGAFGHDGLHPHEFRTEKDGVRSDAATLDWPMMKLTLSDGNGRVREVPLQPGTQDVLSMFYQLGSLISRTQGNDEKITKKLAGDSFYVTTGRKLERYRFDLLGDENLTLPQRGRQRALHVRTLAGDQTIDVWLAYELRGLPIRIRYTDGKGDSYDQMADEIEFEDKATQSQAQTPSQSQTQTTGH